MQSLLPSSFSRDTPIVQLTSYFDHSTTSSLAHFHNTNLQTSAQTLPHLSSPFLKNRLYNCVIFLIIARHTCRILRRSSVIFVETTGMVPGRRSSLITISYSYHAPGCEALSSISRRIATAAIVLLKVFERGGSKSITYLRHQPLSSPKIASAFIPFQFTNIRKHPPQRRRTVPYLRTIVYYTRIYTLYTVNVFTL